MTRSLSEIVQSSAAHKAKLGQTGAARYRGEDDVQAPGNSC